MTLDRAAFFAAVRGSLFGGRLTPAQVGGIGALLDVWEREHAGADPRWLAYILAGVFHETGAKMVPVREGFAATDAAARAAVAKLHAQGRIRTNYALPVNGVSYYGRGRIQNTHLANMRKLEARLGHPFVANPDLLLDDAIDAEVTIVGHVEGLWTGRKLADFFGPTKDDPVGARRIVNGTDKAALIAGYHKAFAAALAAARIVTAPAPAAPRACPTCGAALAA